MKHIDKIRGCLLGGAIGDALGYPVEFLSAADIYRHYGEDGIREYALENGVARISDDTQMTLFTANGLLLGTTRGKTRGIMGPYADYISLCYRDWYKTQGGARSFGDPQYTWLVNIPELHARRAPGNTCLSAIASGRAGTPEEPINNSKGCGGIMRVAPIGVYFDDAKFSSIEIARMGAEAAALTHGHELGYMPAAALAHILHLLSHDPNVSIRQAVERSMVAMRELFPEAKHLGDLLGSMQRAIDLASEKGDDLAAIERFGEGWVAEETLAIAIYCSLKYNDRFDKAVIAAVNHGGDSDSTGAVTGNIMGASLGLAGIPDKYLENLELKDIILELADDLFHDCQMSEYDSYRDAIWEHKYVDKDYDRSQRNSKHEATP